MDHTFKTKLVTLPQQGQFLSSSPEHLSRVSMDHEFWQMAIGTTISSQCIPSPPPTSTCWRACVFLINHLSSCSWLVSVIIKSSTRWVCVMRYSLTCMSDIPAPKNNKKITEEFGATTRFYFVQAFWSFSRLAYCSDMHTWFTLYDIITTFLTFLPIYPQKVL